MMNPPPFTRRPRPARVPSAALALAALVALCAPASAFADAALSTEFSLLIGRPSAESAGNGVLVVPGIVLQVQSDERLDAALAGDGGEEAARQLVRNTRLKQVADNLKSSLRLSDVEVRYQTRHDMATSDPVELPPPVSTSNVRVNATLLGFNETSASYAVKFTEGDKLITDTPLTVKRGKQAVVGGLDGEDAPYLFLVIAPDAVGDKRSGAGLPRHVGGDVAPPIALVKPAPQYTPEAREQKLQGVVIVQAIIDSEGKVVDVKVLRGLPYGLSEAAVDTIKTWEFQPATLDGEPVDVYYNLTVNFRLE
ncbi:MAG: energy transducer TonB [Acidobacteriota bacterium]